MGWLADGQTGSERSYPASQLQVAVWSPGGMVRGVNSSVFKEEYGAGSSVANECSYSTSTAAGLGPELSETQRWVGEAGALTAALWQPQHPPQSESSSGTDRPELSWEGHLLCKPLGLEPSAPW